MIQNMPIKAPYAIALRIRHPSIDPRVISKTLDLKPDHAWKCGDPRSDSSVTARSNRTYPETYWSASLTEVNPLVPPSPAVLELGSFLHALTLKLQRHHSFFESLRADHGQASVLVEASVPYTLSAELMRMMAELGLDFEYQTAAEEE